MIRKNLHGNLLQIHPSTFVDPTAILCGLMVVEELVLGHQPIQIQLWGMDSSTRRFAS